VRFDAALKAGFTAVRYVASRLRVSNDVRVGQQPMVRVVATYLPQIGILVPCVPAPDDFLSQRIDPDTIILKNIGPGPALAAVVFDPENAALLGSVPAVMPLGHGVDEAHRIGRATVDLTRALEVGNHYALYYQDRLRWYLTRFHVKKDGIEDTLSGPVSKVPPEVEAQGRVAAS
jgi:hypothetical protein